MRSQKGAKETEDRPQNHTQSKRKTDQSTSQILRFPQLIRPITIVHSKKSGVKGEDFLASAFKLQIPGTASDSAHKSHDLVGTGAARRRTVGSTPTFLKKMTACVYLCQPRWAATVTCEKSSERRVCQSVRVDTLSWHSFNEAVPLEDKQFGHKWRENKADLDLFARTSNSHCSIETQSS